MGFGLTCGKVSRVLKVVQFEGNCGWGAAFPAAPLFFSARRWHKEREWRPGCGCTHTGFHRAWWEVPTADPTRQTATKELPASATALFNSFVIAEKRAARAIPIPPWPCSHRRFCLGSGPERACSAMTRRLLTLNAVERGGRRIGVLILDHPVQQSCAARCQRCPVDHVG